MYVLWIEPSPSLGEAKSKRYVLGHIILFTLYYYSVHFPV